MDRVYLDHNATTPVRPEVLEAMLPYLREQYGNPNSPYWLGQQARAAVEKARAQVAALLGAADPVEIVFTSCGSESDVMAVSGALWKSQSTVVSSAIEHDAIGELLIKLGKKGTQVKK